jgi:hypothetical protein
MTPEHDGSSSRSRSDVAGAGLLMPGTPSLLDLVTVWCLAFEILTRTAIEMPAAAVRELEPVPRDPETERCVAKVLGRMVPAARPYLSPAEREFLEGAHAGRH